MVSAEQFDEALAASIEDVFTERPAQVSTLNLYDECMGDLDSFSQIVARLNMRLGDGHETLFHGIFFNEQLTASRLQSLVLQTY